MTFDKTDEDSVITKFEINGEAVEIDPEATSWSYTSTSLDAGWQVTAVNFSTVESYLTDSISNYYGDLVKNDIGLNKISGTSGSTYSQTGNAAEFSYSDRSAQKVSKAAVKAINDSLQTIKSMTNATIKEKLEKIDTLVAAAKTTIDTEYAKLVKEAKESASKTFSEEVGKYLTDSSTKSYVTSDDVESLEDDGLAAIEAATTLQGVFEAYGEKAKVTFNSLDYTSSYYDLITKQKAVISAVTSEVSNADDILQVKTKPADIAKQNAIIEALEEFGVTVEELPSEVAKTYVAKALEARSFEESSIYAGKTTLEVEGVEAVQDAADGVKTALYNGILAKYKAEVNSLTSASAELKTSLNSALENAASAWKNSSATSKDIVAGYLGASYNSTTGDVTYSYASEHTVDTFSSTDTLLGTLELVLKNNGNAEVKAERVSKVLAEYKVKWANDLAEVKANDSDYVDAITLVMGTSVYAPKEAELGLDGCSVDNFVFGDDGTASSSINSIEREKSGDIYYSAEAMYENLVDGYKWDSTSATHSWKVDTTAQAINNPGKFDDVKAAKTWAQTHDNDIKKSYKLFMTELADQLGTLVSEEYEADSPNFIDNDTVSGAFVAKVFNLKTGDVIVKEGELETIALNAKNNATLLNTLETGLSGFVSGLKPDNETALDEGDFNVKTADSSFTVAYINTGYGKFYEEALDATNEDSAFSKILTGNMTSDEVAKFVSNSNLKALYKEDVLDYTQEALANFQDSVASFAYEGGLTPNQKKALNSAAEVVESLFDDKYAEFDISGLVYGVKADGTTKATSSSDLEKYLVDVDSFIKFGTNDDTNLSDKYDDVAKALKELLTAMGFTVTTSDWTTTVDRKIYIDKAGTSNTDNLFETYSIANANGFSAKALDYVKAIAKLF